ncbi:MAG: 16S rRNA (cytidine(1402)-2'-O)-methyltransferase [Candidatus Taylorbacteria bacterium]|nr:16S rRNA (cytidine(1402)-2'-O)-methyltransferase [Candidatus Taylorbacteria bacterium]
MSTTFSVIGTPIGNLEDITLRAISILKSSDLILCEDTRMTKKLLVRYDIHTATMSYHMHSKLARVEQIIGFLKEGKNLALVSDAGTPGISDPGAELMARIRLELAEQISDGTIKIESIPGPSALTAALSISGVPCASFTFLGFLPHKKGRETLFKEIAASERTVVFYESPHRIMKALESLVAHLSHSAEIKPQPARSDLGGLTSPKVTICRELTKIFEEVVSGTAEEVKRYFESHQDNIRGEFVVIVSR